jgi:hypothetical protein
MTSPATISEWMTIAVPTEVGDVLKLTTIPPTETRKALMLKDIRIWASAITIMGNQDVCCRAPALVDETLSVVILFASDSRLVSVLAGELDQQKRHQRT